MAVATNNDSATAARDLSANDTVAAIVELAPAPPAECAELAGAGQGRLLPGSAVVGTRGRHDLREISVAPLSGRTPDLGAQQRIDVDHLAVSGGWTPSVHLHSQGRAPLAYEEPIHAFVPAGDGAAAYHRRRGERNVRHRSGHRRRPARRPDQRCAHALPLPVAPPPGTGFGAEVTPVDLPSALARRCFVDLQNDVTAKDIGQARQEGYISVEHVKRYTTLGMGTDQGKTGNLNGVSLLATGLDTPTGAVG